MGALLGGVANGEYINVNGSTHNPSGSNLKRFETSHNQVASGLNGATLQVPFLADSSLVQSEVMDQTLGPSNSPVASFGGF